MLGELQDTWNDVGLRKVGHRIAVGLEEHKDVLAIGDPGSPESHAHPSAQPFDIQEPLRQRFGNEKPTNCSGREWTLLPGQPHKSPPMGYSAHDEAREPYREHTFFDRLVIDLG